MNQCTNCGNPVDPNTDSCPACGSRINTEQNDYPSTQNPYAQQPPPSYGQQPQQTLYDNPAYMQIGGWLLVFVIGGIITTVYNINLAINTIRDNTEMLNDAFFDAVLPDDWKTAINLEIIASFIIFLAAVFQIIFVVQVFQRKKAFLLFEQLTFITLLFSGIIMIVALNMIGFSEFEENEVSQTIGGTIGYIAGLFLYTLYYSRSVRVRTYMGNDEYLDRALFTLK